jgi:hypothetical protein
VVHFSSGIHHTDESSSSPKDREDTLVYLKSRFYNFRAFPQIPPFARTRTFVTPKERNIETTQSFSVAHLNQKLSPTHTMAGMIVAGAVFVGLIAGSSIAYIGYHAYKKRHRVPVLDEERARNLDYTAQHLQQGTALQDVDRSNHEYHSGQWYGSPGIVPANIAPVAKPLPSFPIIAYTGGEGLVSSLERVFVSEEAANGKGKERVLEDDQFKQQQVPVSRGFDPQGFGPGYTNMYQQEEIEILSPKPRRTVTPKVNTTPKDIGYDEEQEKVSGYWEDIENRNNIGTGRKPKNKQIKQPTVLAQDTPRSSAKIEEAEMQDVDLNSSPAWASNKRPATPPRRKTLKIRESFESGTTLGVANNLNSERPLEHIISKQNMEPQYPKPAVVMDKAAETRRKMEEVKRQRAEKLRLEQEERQAEERRQVEQQQEREAEQRRRAEEEKQRIEEARAQTLAQMTGTDVPNPRARKNSSSQRPTEVMNYSKFAFENSSNSGPEESRGRRGSSTSTDAKSSRKSRDKPFSRSPKRANSFAGAVTADATTTSYSRSMSMTEQQRPNFTERMPPIAEAYHGASNQPSQVAAPSPVYSLPRSLTQLQRISDGSSALYSSSTDSRHSSIQPSSNEQRRSDASSLDSKPRDSVDSKKSRGSVRERALNRLSRKGSDKKQTDYHQQAVENERQRNSAGSAQSWENEHDGPGLRGGGGTVFEEPEDMSDDEAVVPRLRGGEGSVEGSGSEPDIHDEGEMSDEEMSDVDLGEHYKDDDEHEKDDESESESEDEDSDDES